MPAPPVTIEVQEMGVGEDLVVLVHGVLDRGRSFSRVGRELQPDCRTVWYDRRGYGATPAPGGPVGIDVHIEDLLGVIDGRRVVLAGHSFGGVIAAGAAVRAPESVVALVMYETALAWVPGWDDTIMQQVLWGDDPEDAGLRLMFRERYHEMSEADLARWRDQATVFVTEERSARTGRSPYDLGSLAMPVVYGYGEQFPADAVLGHLREVVPCVELVPVPGADHNAHRSDPAAFAGLVRRALERARAAPS
jgi:pimeloyl-ACP methyl ester carboxylesterase